MIVINHSRLPRGTLLGETLHIVDCAAPPALGAERFLAPDILRSLMTPDLKDLGERSGFNTFTEHEVEVQDEVQAQIVDSQREGIESMLSAAELSARERLGACVARAIAAMEQDLGKEEARLRYLKGINTLIRDEEINHIVETRAALREHIGQAEVRLDAVRIIIAA